MTLTGQKILWIAFVWPEPTSSAAGVRTWQLIKLLKENGNTVHVCSPCKENSFKHALESAGIQTSMFEPNNSLFDSFLQEYRPEIVFFDRFMVEEQFSFRVKEHCPEAMRVLDTIDIHSLRRLREKHVNAGKLWHEAEPADLNSVDALREMASIYRSDLSLITSDAEVKILTERYRIPQELLVLSRLFCSKPASFQDFSARRDFVSIGNFNHAPNLDSFTVLQREIWPEIRKRFPLGERPELHIYGAYPASRIMQLDDASAGFRVKGWTADSLGTLANYRINLAPLRFGAGIKGKILDGWAAGTPCITTSTGAEGMHSGYDFGGEVKNDWGEFCDEAVKLYTDAPSWRRAQKRGEAILNGLFDEKTNSHAFLETLTELKADYVKRRERNFTGQMLWHHQFRSTEYFSRWIELKNK